jgi:glutamate-5-semialdehyde dehydrogenase
VELLELVRTEAAEANAATSSLSDDAVAEALEAASALVTERRVLLLAANAADLADAAGRLDTGTLDRLRLDEQRIEALAAQVETTASIPPLERQVASWRLDNGLEVEERRIPIGTVGANFEARPNVALDIAAQLLKSLNTAVLRTGGAALRSVTAIVDDVLRPALERAGLPPGAVGLVRSADREGARALVALPREIPLVILRGSGETTAALARLAAENGVRTLAHAEGGGVLYVHGAADPAKTLAIVEASIDRLGVCQRLNLCLVDRAASSMLVPIRDLLTGAGLTVFGTAQAREHIELEPLTEPLGHEWANDPERVASVTLHMVDSPAEAADVANRETSGLAAGIVTEHTEDAELFLTRYRGTAAFWNATTRFTDGFALTGAPETGINVDWTPGPRGPVTYRDLWLRQYRVIGDGTQRR